MWRKETMQGQSSSPRGARSPRNLRREGSCRAIEPIIEKIKAEAIERQRRAGVPRPRSGACKRASGLPSLCPHSDQVSQRSEIRDGA